MLTLLNFVHQMEQASEFSDIQSKKGLRPPLPILSKQAMTKKIRTPVIFMISLGLQRRGLRNLSSLSLRWIYSNFPSLGRSEILAKFAKVVPQPEMPLLGGGAEVFLVLKWPSHKVV